MNTTEEEQLENAAFEAQMRGEDIVPVTDVVEETPPEETDVLAEPERIEILPGYTKEEFDTLVSDIPRVRKALDKAQGTYGTQLQVLQAEVTQLKNSRPNATLSKLSEEYPDIARLLSEDLQVQVSQQQQQPVADLAQYKQELDERIAGFERKLAVEKLEAAHPDYQVIASWSDQNPTRTVVFNDMQFGNWLAQQREETRDAVLTSDDPSVLAKVISDYKKTLAAKDVVRDAVQPKGLKVSVSAKSDEELEEEAFRAEMKKHYR